MRKQIRQLLLLFVLFCFSLPIQSAASSSNSYNMTGVKTLKQLVKRIESQTDYRFSYAGNLVDNVEVSVKNGNQSVPEILNEALSGTNVKYSIRKNDIILTRAANVQAKPAPAESSKVVTGKVVDATTKEPLVGAQIWIKDTAYGVVTDENGNYTLKYSGNYLAMSVSYLGYDSQEIPLKGKTVNVSLQPSSQVIDDVVVVGYGKQKKASIVGAISSVSIDNIKSPVAKISNNLAGQLAGVITVQRSGEPGAGSTFWIRGISTFSGTTTPLVLVDGIERSLDLVDTEDIKEFSILKDAAATAIYGVRGANGVVLITTRSGDEGKPKITFKVEGGYVSPTKVPQMLNSIQFAEMYNEAAGYAYYDEDVMQKYRDGSDPDLYPNVNWTDELYKSGAMNQRVNLNVSGGTNIAKYFISASYYNENGMFATDNMKAYDTSVFYRRYNFRSNVDVKVTPSTTLNVNLATSFERKNTPGTSASTIWSYALKSAPNAFPKFYSDGTLAGPGPNQGENPYVLLTQTGYAERFYNTAQSLFSVNQDLGMLTKGLSANVKVSFDANNYNYLGRTKTPEQWLASGRDEEGNLIKTLVTQGSQTLTYSESHSGWRAFYLEASVNYARSFADLHNVGAMFLFQQSQKNYVGVSNSEDALPYRNQGIAARLTYDYDSRYFLEGNFGYNGSENFSPGHRFGFFPSVALGWVISNEQFFAPMTDIVDMLKLKASYGLVGNDKIGGGRRFIYNETIINSPSVKFGESFSNYTGLRLGEWPNENVGWETSHKTNIGVDMSLFGKLKIQADYFHEKRTGIFLQRKSIPNYVGLSVQPYVNIGEMENGGFDGSLEYHQKVGEVNLSARGNFTYARNLIQNQDEPDWEYLYMNRTGHPRYQTFGLVAKGLFKDQADIDSWPKQDFGETKPGDIKYLDLNGDGVVNDYDVKAIGYTNVPEIVYGFGASAQWKSWDFSLFFQGVGNVNFFINSDQTQPFISRNMKEANVFSDLYGNYWTQENPDPNAKYPRLTLGTNNNNNRASTFWMVNGRYLRLKNIELGYTLDQKTVRKMHLSGLRFYLSGVNMLTFSKFKLWDPDLQTGATNYPNNRVINAGFALSF